MQRKPIYHSEVPKVIIETIVRHALEEDISSGDVTSEACIDDQLKSEARAVARHEMVACGSAVVASVFEHVDKDLIFEQIVADGTLVKRGDVLWKITGRTRSILMGERVALNLAQRMTGIATFTHSFVQAIPDECETRITDTRKTTPGLRVLERYAVRTGGGYNHRDNLGSAVLIKDNHIAACGSITKAIASAKAYASHTCRIECEVDTLEQLDKVLASGVDIVLLDNMDTTTIVEAVRRAKGKAIIEASGGITLDRIADLARAGVDIISIGAITQSAPTADIGLDM
jgi:nicotinate-nucleotide pyrophosphorylase (carboxylating)